MESMKIYKELIVGVEESMEKSIEILMENGLTDAEIYATIKLMEDKAKKMLEDHIDMVMSMAGEEATTEMLTEGTTIYTNSQR